MHDRIATFGKRPSDDQLAVPLAPQEMGTSDIRIQENKGCYEVAPKRIPIKAIGIWMTFVSLVILGISIYMGEAMPITMSILGLVFITPAMVVMLDWINRRTGDQPYLRVYEQAGKIEFPRLEKSWPVEAVEEVVFINFGGNLFQVAILVNTPDEDWMLVHAFNEAGSGSRLYRKIAGYLGVKATGLRLSTREAKPLLRGIL